jgi:hypothetical protein
MRTSASSGSSPDRRHRGTLQIFGDGEPEPDAVRVSRGTRANFVPAPRLRPSPR